MKNHKQRLLLFALLLGACGDSGDSTSPDLAAVIDLASAGEKDSGSTSPDSAAVIDLASAQEDGGSTSPDMVAVNDLTSEDGQILVQIPDPGARSLNGFWSIPNGGDMGTVGSRPDVAYPAGVISSSPGYIGTDAVPNHQLGAYFVFKTSPTFVNPFTAFWTTDGTVDFAHVHDGAGLIFGAAIAPQNVTVNSVSWQLEPDHVYVLEEQVTGATFF